MKPQNLTAEEQYNKMVNTPVSRLITGLAIPTVISMLFFWPVLITQIWGMVEQSKLDDKALDIAKDVVYMNNNNGAGATTSNGSKFCTGCGIQNAESANFCCGCGRPL